MKIKVLGASGSEVPGHNCPAFLLDGWILLDAGTIGISLNIHEEQGIGHILLTHAHFDHIKGIPFLLDNLVIRNTGNTVTVVSGKDVLEILRKNIFNDKIWPDYTRIPSPDRPVLKYEALTPSRPLRIGEYGIFMERVDHTVPAYGFIVEKSGKKSIAYTGDTGPTERFWKKLSGFDVRYLIVETSFPNHLESLALATGHLTPFLLEKEIAKIPDTPKRILITHVKPQYRMEIEVEIQALGHANIELVKEAEILHV